MVGDIRFFGKILRIPLWDSGMGYGIMIAQSAIRHDYIVTHLLYRAAPLRGDYTSNPRLEGKMPPPASLSPPRAWYNVP